MENKIELSEESERLITQALNDAYQSAGDLGFSGVIETSAKSANELRMHIACLEENASKLKLERDEYKKAYIDSKIRRGEVTRSPSLDEIAFIVADEMGK